MTMNEENAAKAKDVSPKTTAILVDALSPLVSRTGIVALNVTALVALDGLNAVPVVVTLGISPEAVGALMTALRGYASGNVPMLDEQSFPVQRPAKN